MATPPAGNLFQKSDVDTEQNSNDEKNLSNVNVRDSSTILEDEHDNKPGGDHCLHSLIGDGFDYKMNHNEAGCFLIICNDEFNNKKLGSRNSAKDLKYLKEIALKFGFCYKILQNETKQAITEFVEAVTQHSHDGYNCFFCVILTHGAMIDSEEVLCVRDGHLKLKDITDLFNADKCQTLANKPKCFFIQACRGGKKENDIAAPLPHSNLEIVESDADGAIFDDSPEDKMEMDSANYYIPRDADFLIAYSTPTGHSAFRNERYGSWFIEAMHYCFLKYGDSLSLGQIMTKVNMTVAKLSEVDKGEVYMQIPSMVNQLRGDVHLKMVK